ncbi:hypothetical protein ABI066_16170, partial [Enterococcus faecium]
KHGLMTVRSNDDAKAHDDHTNKPAMEKMAHGSDHQMGGDATTPQLVALAGVTGFLLISGMVIPGFSVNLSLSARDVDASIMPPG